ncbi:MAG: tRNA (adenosine(37)-N6)-dimethylallyltransferase MiaA [Rhodocyclaceae bacterium]|nr:tRNA (adenosine(37)-N6)-dimethylallyltransferase MiaA [Rhodocyclaceae bacterium]MCA3021507.1 tRNA (adenosine(37)-N6)-dimethylallyltransferase MiaA [Rhodocyclaceae bacterium]MCA3054054.1 tRNA (adenosine(37)-N6)-dimethylallyltransferase MiaA [Rhodocyclaceae bacterium]
MSSAPATPVLFLLGPTASGKTALASRLVDRFVNKRRIEIVSVDSALVYREMNIGTAKPDSQMLADYPHHMIDLIDPDEIYSAADYRRDVLVVLAGIVSRGAVPLMVGGTMMYVKTLLEGISVLPKADPAIRAALTAEAALVGWAAMHAKLVEVDELTAARLEPNDSQRIQRALEVYLISGVPMSELHQREMTQSPKEAYENFPYIAHLLALVPSDRAVLHGRIAERFDEMLRADFIDEVRQLRERFELTPDLPSMRAVGYRQVWQFLEGEINEEQLRAHGIAATRQLAKRQLTWLRSMPNASTYDCLDRNLSSKIETHVEGILKASATN